MKTTKGSKTKRVMFSLLASHAHHVSVAGDFNCWDTATHARKKDQIGVWKLSVNLAPGSYQYRFFVDGAWQNDPQSTDCVPNPFGTLNCVRQVG